MDLYITLKIRNYETWEKSDDLGKVFFGKTWW